MRRRFCVKAIIVKFIFYLIKYDIIKINEIEIDKFFHLFKSQSLIPQYHHRLSGGQNWISFKNSSGTSKWAINNLNTGTDFNFSETGVADGRLYLKAGGNVGIGTTAPGATLDVSGTGSIKIPVGTTAQRPSSPVAGMMRFNTDSSRVEFYNGIAWTWGGVSATGGTVTDIGGYRIHTFTTSGTFTVGAGGNIEVLVVAGGGGGGGGGGIVYGSTSISAGQVIAVTVGTGGTGGAAAAAATGPIGTRG